MIDTDHSGTDPRPPLEEFIRLTSEPGCSWGMADSDVVEICEYAIRLEAQLTRLGAGRDSLAEKAKLYDYMQEVAKANGYDCLTDAITKANAYGKERDTLAEQLAVAATLRDAMWQLLDDMGTDGTSVCVAAKAQARVAFEPYRSGASPLDWPVAEAARILSSLEQRKESEPGPDMRSGGDLP